MGDYTLTALGPATELLDLPFDRPLAEWDEPRLVAVPRGISRHVVRFVRARDRVFAIKEATDRFVLREHDLLRELANRSVPVVGAFGAVTGRRARDGTELGGLLITRHLPFSVPYRALFTGMGVPDLRARLLDALAELFARIHLAGFYWGDCSLSNTLFRRDAGALAAYLVDAETGELHPRLSDGQRGYDLDIATENIAGELFDLRAAGDFPADVDPLGTATALRPRYERLWDELTSDQTVAVDESYRIDARIKRLNRLGFDLAELSINSVDGGRRLRFATQIVEPGHHRRRILRLTGLTVGENQARGMLADLARFRAKWAEGIGQEIDEDAAARRWLDEKYYPTLAMVPPALRGKLPDAELFHEINEHRWFLSEAQGRDVGRSVAVEAYARDVLAALPEASAGVVAAPEHDASADDAVDDRDAGDAGDDRDAGDAGDAGDDGAQDG
ncbi:MAG: DUF4032 domain-containing protein [Actinomycetia bacterium]|nr:DUF4032 domain-containing protein [Actinomycetes bacterium]